MKNKSIYDEIFDKPCEVCGKIVKKDVYEQCKCVYCGWNNCYWNVEHPDRVAYPNLISLNKARQLYKEGKSFEPNLDEFIESLFIYSETQFEYKGIYYAVELVGRSKNNVDIQLYNSKTREKFLFKTKEDFKNNAKIDGKLLKDIWDETTDRYWLQ